MALIYVPENLALDGTHPMSSKWQPQLIAMFPADVHLFGRLNYHTLHSWKLLKSATSYLPITNQIQAVILASVQSCHWPHCTATNWLPWKNSCLFSEHLTLARADFNQSIQRQPPTEGTAENGLRALFFVASSKVSFTNAHTQPH